MDRVDELLKAALEQGRPSDIDAWAGAGRAGLLRLRRFRSPSAHEATLARQAIESILARIDDGRSR